MTYHPAALLGTWLALALALQWLTLPALVSMTALFVGVASVRAPLRLRALLRRSRWLLITLAGLYLLATPGEYLAGPWAGVGITVEGVTLGGEQILRLLALLASLAWLHETIGTRGLLTGLYWWGRPFPGCATGVVRLMLVLEQLEARTPSNWRHWLSSRPEEEGVLAVTHLALELPALRGRDVALMSLSLAALIALILYS